MDLKDILREILYTRACRTELNCLEHFVCELRKSKGYPCRVLVCFSMRFLSFSVLLVFSNPFPVAGVHSVLKGVVPSHHSSWIQE